MKITFDQYKRWFLGNTVAFIWLMLNLAVMSLLRGRAYTGQATLFASFAVFSIILYTNNKLMKKNFEVTTQLSRISKQFAGYFIFAYELAFSYSYIKDIFFGQYVSQVGYRLAITTVGYFLILTFVTVLNWNIFLGNNKTKIK